MFKSNEVIFLLGAGASVEAEIPHSKEMIDRIESLIESDDAKWSGFRDLYYYIRSAIYFADGLDGKFDHHVPYNIERLVNVLEEIQKKQRHALYPFVGTWNHKLQELAGPDFDRIVQFRRVIIETLLDHWVVLPERERANYYGGLLKFQREYQHSLRVFSLNYDLCVEETCGRENVQRGFSDRTWDWRLFEVENRRGDTTPLFLYKLHGSVDWYFDRNSSVKFSDAPSTISKDSVAIIFGSTFKLQYIDPFLYLAFELRRWTLDSVRIIVCVGYGFNDKHINGILKQSLRHDDKRIVVAVVGNSGTSSQSETTEFIANQLESETDRIRVVRQGASEFFESTLSIQFLAQFVPEDIDEFEELRDG